MKHLLLLLLFSGSLDGFSQEIKTLEYPPKVVDGRVDKIDTLHIGRLKLIFRNDTLYNQYFAGPMLKGVVKPDTLRAICLVTLFQNGIAHARMGYVVICEGKEVEYLDCRKRALKLPQAGWGYRVVNPNEKLK